MNDGSLDPLSPDYDPRRTGIPRGDYMAIMAEKKDVVERRIDVTKEKDPWVHRSEGMRCRTCIWFVPKQRIGASNSDVNALIQVGRCRRHAPTMNGYPVVYMTDWCGDHRIDENKV